MRVLIYETSAEGHRLSYLAHMIPELLGMNAEVTIALPRIDENSAEFDIWLKPFLGRVSLDAYSTDDEEFRPATGGDRARFLLESVRRCGAEHVYVPSADGLAQSAAYNLPLRRGHRFESEVGVLRGGFAYATTFSRSLRYRAGLALLRWSPWNLLHFIDVIAFDQLRSRGGNLARRARMLPDPIGRIPATPKAEARRAMGIPEDGRYIASTGTMTHRKGIHLLLHAFKHAPLRPTDRLLLSGKFDTETRTLLDRDYADLLRSGRIIAIDRYLEEHELPLTLSAADLIATPYVGHLGVASIVIRAASVGRPLIANDNGWTGVVVPRLGLGWTSPVTPEAFTARLPKALDDAEGYTAPEVSRRFVDFHDISNFRACMTARLRERLGLPPSPDHRPWDWVLTGDPNTPAPPLLPPGTRPPI